MCRCIVKEAFLKIFVFAVAILFLSSNITPVALSVQPYKKNTDVVTAKILEVNNNGLKMREISVASDEIKKIIGLINEKPTSNTFANQLEHKLNVLRETGVISNDQAVRLTGLVKHFHYNKMFIGSSLFFDVFNLFNGIFFGVKGNRDKTFLKLDVVNFPFFNGTLTAGFTGFTNIVGNGSVFTLGTLGFKYIYNYNKTKYEFPYFSGVKGNILGFSGILIEFEVEGLNDEKIEGTYLMGVGMTVLTIWNIQQQT